LNYFEPYESLPAHHENQLTRAFVVVLKLSPMAHAAWLRRVDGELVLHELPVVEWRVQRSLLVNPDATSDFDDLRVISVFISGERADAGGQVEATERSQILDAVAVYGTELAVVVENKVTGFPDDLQSRSLNIGGVNVNLDERPRRIRWRDILGDFAELVSRDLIAGAEKGVVEDFLQYTEAYFDDLMPFNTLAVCHGSPPRQQRRLRVILADASGVEARQEQRPNVSLPGATMVERAYLEFRQDEVRLGLYPGDTLKQARSLYSRSDAVAGLRQLRLTDWQLLPGFHWGYRAKGFAWTRSLLDVDAYIDLWVREIGQTYQVKRPAWDAYWAWLVDNRVVAQEARDAFRVDFDDTDRQYATPRPGLRLELAWPLVQAKDLDQVCGRFVGAVRGRLREALAAMHENVIWPTDFDA
jgi:hypothetical protein